MKEPGWGQLSNGKLPQVGYMGQLIEILNQSSTMERNLHWFSSAVQMGPNFLSPIQTHENKRKIWKSVRSAIPVPTRHVPQNKACSSSFDSSLWKDLSPFSLLLSLLRHSSTLKNAMFLILLPRSCPTASLHWAEPTCEAEQRRWPSCCLARGSGSRNCPGQEGLASPIPTWDSSMACTHPGWMEQQLPARGAAMPGGLGISKGDHRHWAQALV